MKLLIFGSTGGTGRQLVDQALALGHSVTAFARNPSMLPVRHADLRVVQGDVMDPASVQRAIPGHDAVLSALGSPAHKTGTIRSQGTLNIVRAMEKAGIRRFVCQTSSGYGDSVAVLDKTPFLFKHLIVPLLLRRGFADHALQEEYIKGSQLDWVIVRPGIMTDGPRTVAYRHGFAPNDRSITAKIARADVAHFMLEQVASDTCLHMTPCLSY